MAGRLAPVPEESMDGSTAAYPPRSSAPYRDLIRRVAVSRRQIRSTLFSQYSQSGHSGSSYSSDSASKSNNSGYSSGSAAAVELEAQELKAIAHRMVIDGYTQRMVQAFSDASPGQAALGYNGDPDHALNAWFSALLQPFDMVPATPTHLYSDDQNRVLETWFFELDVDWVLQIRQEHDSQWQLRLQDKLGSSLEDLVERWIRGLTVIVYSNSIVDLRSSGHEMTAVKRFGEASILKMHVFIDAMVPAWKAENLRSVLDMHICVHKTMDIMERAASYSEGLYFLLLYLSLAAYKLKEAISSTMKKMRTLVEDDDSWAIEIPRGGGEVHRNTRWIADCIVSLGEAEASQFFASIINSTSLLYDSTKLSAVRCDTISYLKDLLLRKSELCSDPSLRYLFLLNNSYFAAEMIQPCQPGHDLKLTPECEKYMDSYLDVSWEHVLSCIPRSHSRPPLQRWMNTDPLVKFESAFNKTYQAQKFWKVTDPRLRGVLRRAIIDRVISSYRDYLNEHPELAEHVNRRKSTPEVFVKMLSQIFEG